MSLAFVGQVRDQLIEFGLIVFDILGKSVDVGFDLCRLKRVLHHLGTQHQRAGTRCRRGRSLQWPRAPAVRFLFWSIR